MWIILFAEPISFSRYLKNNALFLKVILGKNLLCTGYTIYLNWSKLFIDIDFSKFWFRDKNTQLLTHPSVYEYYILHSSSAAHNYSVLFDIAYPRSINGTYDYALNYNRSNAFALKSFTVYKEWNKLFITQTL